MSTNASFSISVCGFRWRAPVLKLERILNCTPPTRFLGKENWRYIDQISHRLLLWSSETILNSEIRIKYAETVHSWFKNFHFLHWFEIPHPILSQVRPIKGESQSHQQITRLHRRYPLVKEFPSSERVYLSD